MQEKFIMLDGKFQKIAVESHELLQLIAKETRYNMGDLASAAIWDSLQRNYPQMILRLDKKGLVPSPGQLNERAVRNERLQAVFDPEFDPDQ